MNEINTTLGNFLRASRKAKHFSLRDVESKTDISNAYLSQLESGKIRSPAVKVLYELAKLYDISYADLMQFAGYPVPNSTRPTALSDFASRLGPITEEEKDELIDYLAFLRNRKKP